MSKERRVDPQILIGLLVDPTGFPLEVHAFAGNRGETTTLLPVLNGFRERHGRADVVVVADAGMLSAANLNALEEAGFDFIVGSRTGSAPRDLADHYDRVELLRRWRHRRDHPGDGNRQAKRTRRVVWHYSRARERATTSPSTSRSSARKTSPKDDGRRRRTGSSPSAPDGRTGICRGEGPRVPRAEGLRHQLSH
ncbi:transposase [Gordonia sp. (in: high G+C Gram-positive bacteria)]|uniref:IS1634 family transposase n=1 Tax=Gordonia sp. (in: high G+C Gram-positive bacteria) TaxID=84139 RepID=UPI003528BE65